MAGREFARVRSREDLEIEARNARALFEIANEEFVDVIDFLFHKTKLLHPDFRIEVAKDHELRGKEACSLYDPVGIKFCPKVMRAIRGAPENPTCSVGVDRARFTIGHEIGHILMHPLRELNRSIEKGIQSDVSPLVCPEYQANYFSGAFWAPRSIVLKCESPEELARRVGLSLSAAEIRMKQLELWPRERKINEKTQAIIDEIMRNAGMKQSF